MLIVTELFVGCVHEIQVKQSLVLLCYVGEQLCFCTRLLYMHRSSYAEIVLQNDFSENQNLETKWLLLPLRPLRIIAHMDY